MPDYKALYLKLCGVQTDAIVVLQSVTDDLIRAHQEAEEAVMNAPETNIRLLDPNRGDEQDE